MVSRPLRVEELAEFLAIDFKAGPIPKYREDWRLEDPVEAVLSTCSTLLALVNIEGSPIIQFSHFSVKEFLTSSRFSGKGDTISQRYHISPMPAHTLVAQACLSILLHLDKNITRDGLANFPLARYAAENWFGHARFEGVSRDVDEGMKQLFDRRKPHLAVWVWIWERGSTNGPVAPQGTALHYSAFCGLNEIVKVLAIENPEDVDSWSFDDESRPLHLASREGHVEVVRTLIEHSADIAPRTKYGSTPLHQASGWDRMEVARLLIEHGADSAAQTEDGWTPLHCAASVDLARLLIEHGADAAAQTDDGLTPLHCAASVDVARLLIERGADAAAQNKDGSTPLHRASAYGRVEVAQLLIEHGADAAALTKDGSTPLHWTSSVEVARLLIEHGADAAAQTKDGSTPLHRASERGHIDVAQLLIEHGADAAARTKDGLTPAG